MLGANSCCDRPRRTDGDRGDDPLRMPGGEELSFPPSRRMGWGCRPLSRLPPPYRPWTSEIYAGAVAETAGRPRAEPRSLFPIVPRVEAVFLLLPPSVFKDNTDIIASPKNVFAGGGAIRNAILHPAVRRVSVPRRSASPPPGTSPNGPTPHLFRRLLQFAPIQSADR